MSTKTMRDAMGNDVPINYVKKEDKLRDRNVRRIEARFRKARALLEKVVSESLADIDEIVSARASVSEKGNISCRSFDGLIQVDVRQAYTVTLDAGVMRARELLVAYVGKQLEAVGNKAYVVQKIVEAAFKADSRGFLNLTKINDLLRLEVRDAEWLEAIAILKEAMSRQKGKRYLSCRVRPDSQHDYEAILLDIADCWPEGERQGSRVKGQGSRAKSQGEM